MSDPPRNRAILLTPPGVAAIAVIRFAGPGVIGFLREHLANLPGATIATTDTPALSPSPCTGRGDKTDDLPILTPGQALHLYLHDGAEILDDPIVFFSPDSSLADVSIHGSPLLVQCVLDLAGRAGFEIVRPALDPENPLPLDAVDGDSILEREVNASLPLACSERAVRMLLHQPTAWAALKAADPLQRQLHFAAILSDRTLWHSLSPPRVAIVGIPNSGKSTLANALFGRDRTITADLPGTTRDWVADIAHIDGLPITLIDTPGQRQTADAIESQAIINSVAAIAGCDLVLLLLDRSQPLSPEQSRLLQAYPAAIRIINKCDLPPAWSGDVTDFTPPIPIVATTGQGLAELRQQIRSYFQCDSRPIDAPRIWTDRQKEILLRAPTDPSALADL